MDHTLLGTIIYCQLIGYEIPFVFEIKGKPEEVYRMMEFLKCIRIPITKDLLQEIKEEEEMKEWLLQKGDFKNSTYLFDYIYLSLNNKYKGGDFYGKGFFKNLKLSVSATETNSLLLTPSPYPESIEIDLSEYSILFDGNPNRRLAGLAQAQYHRFKSSKCFLSLLAQARFYNYLVLNFLSSAIKYHLSYFFYSLL